jgi:hypothetical protein
MRFALVLWCACALIGLSGCDQRDAATRAADKDKEQFDDLIETTWVEDFPRSKAATWLRQPGKSFYGLDTKQVIRLADELEAETGASVYVTMYDIDPDEALTLLVRLPDDPAKRAAALKKREAFVASSREPVICEDGNRWFTLAFNSEHPDEARSP